MKEGMVGLESGERYGQQEGGYGGVYTPRKVWNGAVKEIFPANICGGGYGGKLDDNYRCNLNLYIAYALFSFPKLFFYF